jgi:hypothetical protein
LSRFVVRRLRLGELLDEAFQLLKATFSRLIVFQALVYAPSLALAALAVHAAGRWLTGLLEGELEPQLPSLVIGTVGFFFGFLALQVLLGAITQVALTKGAAQSYLDEGAATVSGLLTHARRLFLRSFGLGLFLTLLLVLAFALPTATVVAAAALVIGGGSENLIGAVLLVLAGGVFGLGGVAFATFVYLRYALAGAVLAIEDTTVALALARSVVLMKGRYGSALALLSILTAIGLMVGGILSIAVPTPAFEGKDLGEIRALLPQLIRSQMISQVFGQVAGALSGLYTSVCWTLFYFSARCEAEGFDLAHQAAKLGEE